MDKNFEMEVKLACEDLDRFRKAGFTLDLIRPRHFEDNWLLDSFDQKLLKQGAALRVRCAEGKGFVTYKGAVIDNGDSVVKIREEVETETTDPEQMIKLFERVGFHRAFRYQKYRTIYGLALDEHELKVTFDETPMGNFIEIEGEQNKILRVIGAMGFSASDVIRESYPELQAARCKARNIALEDLIFSAASGDR